MLWVQPALWVISVTWHVSTEKPLLRSPSDQGDSPHCERFATLRRGVGGKEADLAWCGALCPAIAQLVQAVSPEHPSPSVPQGKPD